MGLKKPERKADHQFQLVSKLNVGGATAPLPLVFSKIISFLSYCYWCILRECYINDNLVMSDMLVAVLRKEESSLLRCYAVLSVTLFPTFRSNLAP
jgi:hypothetical protein